jgi:dTDP-4-dehydrorhamnose 3,5-epimerase
MERCLLVDIRVLNIPGCYEISFPNSKDHRGYFVKNFQEKWFDAHHINVNFVEEYYTISHKGVLRGLHFQRPPYAHAKMLYCLYGEVMDVIVDLRKGSPMFGKYEILELNQNAHNGLYLAPGIAHGFLVTGEEAIMQYKVTSYYEGASDDGIRWDSLGVPWPNMDPIISDRDHNFVEFCDLDSPFNFDQSNDE